MSRRGTRPGPSEPRAYAKGSGWTHYGSPTSHAPYAPQENDMNDLSAHDLDAAIATLQAAKALLGTTPTQTTTTATAPTAKAKAKPAKVVEYTPESLTRTLGCIDTRVVAPNPNYSKQVDFYLRRLVRYGRHDLIAQVIAQYGAPALLASAQVGGVTLDLDDYTIDAAPTTKATASRRTQAKAKRQAKATAGTAQTPAQKATFAAMGVASSKYAQHPTKANLKSRDQAIVSYRREMGFIA